MSIKRLISLNIPTFLASFLFGFIPWGLTLAVITLTLYAVVIFFPSRSMARVNANIALEGLTHGDVNRANDYVEIALREAQSASKLGTSDIKLLRNACDKVATALIDSGQIDAGVHCVNALKQLSLVFHKASAPRSSI